MSSSKVKEWGPYLDGKAKYMLRDTQWFKSSCFFTNDLPCEEKEVPLPVLTEHRKFLKNNKRPSSLSTWPECSNRNIDAFVSSISSAKSKKLSSKNQKNDELFNFVCGNFQNTSSEIKTKEKTETSTSTEELKKKVDRFNKRSEERYDCLSAALNESLRLEKERIKALKKLERPQNAAIKGEKVILNLLSDTFTLDFEKDFFHIDNLLDFCNSKNVVPVNFYDFFLTNQNRVIHLNDNGACLYCQAHNAESHVTVEASCSSNGIKCPYLQCSCIECYTLDKLLQGRN